MILDHFLGQLYPLSARWFRVATVFFVGGLLRRALFSSVQFSLSVVSDSLRPHEPQRARPPCPSLTPGVHPNPCPLSRWCHLTISSSVILFSCLQSFPASGSFPKSQFFISGGQSIGVSASTSVLPMNIQDWFPVGLTGLMSLQSKRLSRVYHEKEISHLQKDKNGMISLIWGI